MKHLHENQEFRFNEVLFENRNKEYGAYVLRNESDRILTKALFIGVSLLAAVSITPLVISAFTNHTSIHVPVDGPPVVVDLHNVNTPEVPVVLPPQTTKAPDVKTYDDRVPEPTSRPVQNTEIIDKSGAVASTQNHDGDIVEIPTYRPTTPNIGNVNVPYVAPTPPAVLPKVEDNSPKTIVDVEADFMGGLDSFRNKVMNNFDNSGFESEDVMKTTITFIVETNGTISAIKADGKNADFNSEALRTVKSVKGKWVPAKVKGQAVRSYFKFPISMKFDN